MGPCRISRIIPLKLLIIERMGSNLVRWGDGVTACLKFGSIFWDSKSEWNSTHHHSQLFDVSILGSRDFRKLDSRITIFGILVFYIRYFILAS